MNNATRHHCHPYPAIPPRPRCTPLAVDVCGLAQAVQLAIFHTATICLYKLPRPFASPIYPLIAVLLLDRCSAAVAAAAATAAAAAARGELDDEGEQYEVDFLRKGGAAEEEAGGGEGRRGGDLVDTMLQAVSGTGEAGADGGKESTGLVVGLPEPPP